MGETGKQINAATTRNRTRELSIIDQMSVLTNQVNLRIQFRHRFDQKCPFTDFAQTSSVSLEIILVILSLIYEIEIFEFLQPKYESFYCKKNTVQLQILSEKKYLKSRYRYLNRSEIYDILYSELNPSVSFHALFTLAEERQS